MKILVDLVHPSDVNFFKNAIKILKKDYNADIDIFALPRGNLVPIFKKECGGYPFKSIGNYRTSLIGKAFGVADRGLQMLKYYNHHKFDVATGFGGIGISHVAWILNKPSVIFEDDIEYKLGFYPYKSFASCIVMPEYIDFEGERIVKYKGFKELAYLHPNYFTPDPKILDDYGVEPSQYVFIREVSNTTLNYSSLMIGQLQLVFTYLNDLGFKIIASLEEKSLKKKFESKCIILEEPVEDIYSLLSFSSFTISSGDTMARESCLLGTPTIYTGGRDMLVNRELQKRSLLFKVDCIPEINETITTIVNNNIKKHVSTEVKNAIESEWEDTTKVILNNLLNTISEDPSQRI